MIYASLMVFVLKSVDTIISLVAQKIIPYLGFFSYGDQMFKYGLPDFIRKLSNFDGIMYIRIATNGYSTTEQAYFPLYPMLIRLFNQVIQNPIISGIAISLIASLIGIFCFIKYLGIMSDTLNRKWILLALMCYPVSYYFGVIYTEGLFFALLIGTLLSFATNKLILATILGLFLSLTRVQGIFVLIPIGITALYLLWQKKPWLKYGLVAVGPLGGLAAYMTYLWQTMGDPLYFFHAQESFGANRSSHLILLPQVLYRYCKIFLTADLSFQYYVAILEFGFFLFALTLLIYDLLLIIQNNKLNIQRLGLNLFSFANILVPSMTGTLTAMPRYSLMSLSIFMVIGELKSKKLKYILFAIFIALHVLMFGLFIQGYYVT